MQAPANFAASCVRLQQQKRLLTEQAKAAAVGAMANDLAHQINLAGELSIRNQCGAFSNTGGKTCST
jgi:hypothetical protein